LVYLSPEGVTAIEEYDSTIAVRDQPSFASRASR